jgi:hypothetical protein
MKVVKMFARISLFLLSVSAFGSAAKPLDTSYACVPSYMIFKDSKPHDLCDARPVNAEEGIRLDRRGCAPKVRAAVPQGIEYWISAFPQTRVTLRGGERIKLRRCEFSEVVSVSVEP